MAKKSSCRRVVLTIEIERRCAETRKVWEKKAPFAGHNMLECPQCGGDALRVYESCSSFFRNSELRRAAAATQLNNLEMIQGGSASRRRTSSALAVDRLFGLHLCWCKITDPVCPLP
jgi:hypothetical protein